ncbi:MAG: alpha/beta fold hydrolase [Armatimonadota bacterium]
MTVGLPGEGLLFLHGAGGRGLIWQQQLLAFPRATAPDLPWRAGASSPAQSTTGAWGAAPWGVNRYLAAVRAYVGPAPAPRIVAGHSLGGAIALLWALTVPREVRALILIGTGTRLRVSPDLVRTLRVDRDRGLEQLMTLWFAPHAAAPLKEKSHTLLRAVAPEVLIAQLEAAEAFDVSADVGRITVPTVVVCGADDQVTPPALSRELHEKIPGSHLVIIEDAGHMVMLEQPRATNDAIRAFLNML